MGFGYRLSEAMAKYDSAVSKAKIVKEEAIKQAESKYDWTIRQAYIQYISDELKRQEKQ